MELKAHLDDIMNRLDHKFLNELSMFEGNPSSENIAKYIADELQASLPDDGVRVSRVAVWESENACATYLRGE